MWQLARSLTAWGKLHLLSVLTWLCLSESLAGTWTCTAPALSPDATPPLTPLLLLHQSSITLAVLTHTHSDQKEHSGLNQIKIGFNENTEQIGVIKCRQGSGKHTDLPFLYSFFYFFPHLLLSNPPQFLPFPTFNTSPTSWTKSCTFPRPLENIPKQLVNNPKNVFPTTSLNEPYTHHVIVNTSRCFSMTYKRVMCLLCKASHTIGTEAMEA